MLQNEQNILIIFIIIIIIILYLYYLVSSEKYFEAMLFFLQNKFPCARRSIWNHLTDSEAVLKVLNWSLMIIQQEK